MTDETQPIDDPKLVFYLERRNQIDEWAKLADVEKAVAHQFMLSLLSDTFQFARTQDPEIGVDHLILEGEQLVALWRQSWLPSDATGDSPIPRAMVAIGWWKTVRFDVINAPWVGLRMGSSRNVALRRAVGQIVAERAVGQNAFPVGKPLGKGVWVRSRSVPVTTEHYWKDLMPYRSSLLNAVSEAWHDFADVVDTALQDAAHEAGPTPPL